MSDGTVRLHRDGAIAHVIFDRPAAHNAMTWTMYRELAAACAALKRDAGVRVVVLRGAGGKAFVAGTDIAQFAEFGGADDGLRYERAMEEYLGALESLPMPTLAVVDGFAVGGGLAIAACCDFRIATPAARFGVPIARTLGNCLSMQNYARLVAALGAPTAKRLLLLADMLTADEAKAAGFVLDIVAPEAIDARVAELCERLAGYAPITLRVSKEAIRRLVHAGVTDGDDLVAAAYGSADFREGVAAFNAKRKPRWSGR